MNLNMESTTTDVATESGRVVLDWFSNNLSSIISVIAIFVIAVIATKLISDVFARLLGRTIREDK